MVTLGELVIYIALSWLILVIIANRFNLQQYQLFISSGFLLYIPEFFSKMIGKLASYKTFWNKTAKISLIPTFTLFIAVPLFLLVNLIRGLFFEIVPILDISIIEILRVETFLLTIPVLIVFISLQALVHAIFAKMEGEEVERSGILIIGVIITFFATMTSKDENRSKIKPIAVIVIIQLIIVLLAFPLSTATQSGLDNFYGESEGAIITVIYPNSPAFDSTLQTGDIITEIRLIRDGLSTTDITISSSSEFNRALAQIPPGIEFIIANSEDLQIIIEGIVPPEDVSQQSGSYLGLLTEDFREPHGIFSVLFPLWMEILFRWVINIGLLFSVYSLLPLPRTQGYNLMSEINEIYGFELSDRIKGYISYVSLIVFALNVLYFVF